jgi:hypothetical protein
LFHRKMVSSLRWRQVGRTFVPDENKLQTAHCRSLCRAIIQELKELDRNWRTGNCKKYSGKVYSSHRAHVVIGCDYIALEDYWGYRKKLRFHHRSSLEQKSLMVIPDEWSTTTNAEIVVLWYWTCIKILDISGHLISEIPELDEDERVSWNLALCCLSGDRLAVLSRTDGTEKLSLWDVRNPANVIRLKSRLFNLNLKLDHFSSMKMDDKFIVVSTDRSESMNVYFFPTETLDLHWQKTVEYNFVYGQGMLIFSRESRENRDYDLIKMYDVKSGKCFRELLAKVSRLVESVCFNSKFMVVKNNYGDGRIKLKIYDLEDLKNPNSEANELYVHTLETEDSFPSLSVDETEIFLTEYENVIHRFNFGSFEYFRNEAKSVTLSSPWRSVWRSKGIDEEPLEPARHMEVYTQVLKYFHQLSMDCQAVIETFPIDFNSESFTLGDDLIGYRQCSPSIYDEKMATRQQGMNRKTLQISKTAQISVVGKTIQLIDVTTGNVIKETKLERDAINLHFNCNLLVVVCKIRGNEHLLSVWRVDNSLNLTHLKDVTIGDYDGSLQVDEQFIAVKTGERAWSEETFNFISMKTFQVETSVSSRAKYLQYDNGYLFLSKEENLVGILDVASGTFLRDISIKPSKNYYMIFRANSNYVVMTNIDLKLYVYDLKCLRETAAVPSHLLLISIDLECPVKEVLMNETRIVCLTNNKMFVVDLQPIDRLRCPEF